MIWEASILIFSAFLVISGYIVSKWIKDVSGFIIAGREIGLLLAIGGIGAIGAAGALIVLMSSITVQFGFLASFAPAVGWVFFGIFLYGILIAPAARRSGAETLPQWIEMRFSKGARGFISISQVLGMMGVVALNIVALARITEVLIGWPYVLGVSIFFGIFLTFIVLGGFWSVTLTDFLQLIIVTILLPFGLGVFIYVKGFSFIPKAWPNWLWEGVAGKSIPIIAVTHPSWITLSFLFTVLVFGASYYWMRAASCRNEKVAKKGYLIGGLWILILIPFIYSSWGLFAGALHPSIFAPIGNASPDAAAGVFLTSVAKILLPIAIPVFLALLAASISTGSTGQIGLTAALQRDILLNFNFGEKVWFSRLITFLAGGAVWLVCLYPRGITYLFGYSFAWFIPSALAIVLGLYWRKITSSAILISALIGTGSMAVLQLLQITSIYPTWQIMHTSVAGLIITLGLMVGISVFTEPKYYGESNWEREPSDDDIENDEIEELDDISLEMLDRIRKGYDTMAELVDLSDEDIYSVNKVIEKLDKKRYLIRDSLRGAGLYKFELTEKGNEATPDLSDEEEFLLENYNLDKELLEMLTIIENKEKHYLEYYQDRGYPIVKIQALAQKLIERGFVTDKGIWRRKINLKKKADKALKKIDLDVESA